ncbi:MAG: hypothetical protein AAF658_19375, partial [Myxococcota bacterium]
FDGAFAAVPGWGATAGGDLALVDAGALAAGTNQDASRKLDLFFAMDIDSTLTVGGRLWFGSQSYSTSPDDSLGPIDIDVDSQAATDNTDSQVVGNGTFGNNDFGVAAGATFLGVPGVTLDGALELNLIGIDQSPNENDILSAGALAYGANVRGTYDYSDTWTVGGFARFNQTSLNFEPQRRIDGSNLLPADQTEDPTLPDPSRGTVPTGTTATVDPGTQTAPLEGTQYSASQRELHLAAIGEWSPNSLATLYGSVGLRWDRFADQLEVGSFWSDEQSITFASRFMNIGVVGHVFSWMDLRIGASRRWTSATTQVTSRDNRIPNNGDGPGVAGTAPPVGNEQNTNANRREQTTEESSDVSNLANQTRLSLGALIHYEGFQISGELDQGFLTDGLNFISGSANPLYVWVNFGYDWDYQQDAQVGYGDGTRRPDPHTPVSSIAEP